MASLLSSAAAGVTSETLRPENAPSVDEARLIIGIEYTNAFEITLEGTREAYIEYRKSFSAFHPPFIALPGKMQFCPKDLFYFGALPLPPRNEL